MDQNIFVKNNEDWDCRALPSEFIERFGKSSHKISLFPFIELVTAHEELELVFRGNHYSKNPNSGGEAVIYRNNHAMFTIRAKSVLFNPNYLRYYPDWENALNDLVNIYGYNHGKIPKLGKVKCSKNPRTKAVSFSCSFEKDYISAPITEKFFEKLNDLYLLFSKIFDAFFSTDQAFMDDQFLIWGNVNDQEYKGQVKFKKKKIEQEKIRQQQLFSLMKNQENGYLFYDMEFEQKHQSKEDAEVDRINGLNNKPDMQAIRFDESGNPKAWVFVEVKCTESAYNGNSSLKKHIEKMRKYIANEENLIRRRREAYLMLSQYEKLGLINLKKKINPSVYEKLDAEVVIIFSDEAIQKWKTDTDKTIIALRNKQINSLGEEFQLPDGSSAILIKDM